MGLFERKIADLIDDKQLKRLGRVRFLISRKMVLRDGASHAAGKVDGCGVNAVTQIGGQDAE